MNDILTRPYIKYLGLLLYVVVAGFTTGLSMMQGLPMIGLVPGPVLSYVMGLALSFVISYLIFFKWRAPRRTRLIVGVAVFVAIVVIGLAVFNTGYLEAKRHINEVLGS